MQERDATDAGSDAARAREAVRALEEMQRTLSWRITKPLRSIRRVQLALGSPRRVPTVPQQPRTGDTESLEGALLDRLRRAAGVVGANRAVRDETRGERSLRERVEPLVEAIGAVSIPPSTLAWLVLVAVDGSYPNEQAVDTAARVLRMDGTRGLTELLCARFDEAVLTETATTVSLDVLEDAVVVAVEQIVSSDYHTGIQRVARDAASRWLRRDAPPRLAFFDEARGGLVLLSDDEMDRLAHWTEHLDASQRGITTRHPRVVSGNMLVPWRCRLVVLEMPSRRHCHALRALALAGVYESLSIIGYDLVPVVAAETVQAGLADLFCEYLSVVKRADHLSAISRQSADDFSAFATLVASEGTRGPDVRAHPLPTTVPDLTERQLSDGLRSLELTGLPLVLVVGVHDPRKNHLAVLEAAERLWREGLVFELLLAGGSGWGTREFERYVRELEAAGRMVSIRKRAFENELWAAYRTARFTVFPSLIEGFGLPVTESLASGTPAITSSHGSLAEIAEGGGCLTVDPRSIDELTEAMRRLLTDDDLLERLRRGARDRDFGSWDDYASEVWDFFTRDWVERPQ